MSFCPVETASDYEKEAFVHEAETMKYLKPNANVLQLLGSCLDGGN